MYTTIQAVRETAGFGNAPNLLDDTVEQALSAAEDEVNSTLSGTYTVPFSSYTPKTIEYITKQLAAGFLLIDQYGELNDGSSLDGKARIKEARDQLKRIKSGELALPDAQGTALPSTSSVSSSADDETCSERAFSMGDKF